MSDLAALSAIEDASFTAPYPASLWERLLDDCPESFFVATDQAKNLVGYCVSSLNGDSGHLISIAVHPKVRRKGVATLLLRETFRFLAAQKAVELVLEVNRKNTDAIALYSKLGFETTGIVEKYYSDGSDAVTMRLNISGWETVQGAN